MEAGHLRGNPQTPLACASGWKPMSTLLRKQSNNGNCRSYNSSENNSQELPPPQKERWLGASQYFYFQTSNDVHCAHVPRSGSGTSIWSLGSSFFCKSGKTTEYYQWTCHHSQGCNSSGPAWGTGFYWYRPIALIYLLFHRLCLF